MRVFSPVEKALNCSFGVSPKAAENLYYYAVGWSLFLSGFTSSIDFRQTLSKGCHVLQKCLKAMENLA